MTGVNEFNFLILDEVAKGLNSDNISSVSNVLDYLWWVTKRPVGWTLVDHLRHPAVYCSTIDEKTRALEAAIWIRGSGTPNRTDGS